MSEQRLPYGIHLIEQFVEKDYEPDAGAFAIALGEAMSKSTGKYYRVRWEAYEKHFDHVITELCIKPVYKELETDDFKLPPYRVMVVKEFKAMGVRITFEHDKQDDFMLQYVIDYWNLYDQHPFEHLAHGIHRYLKSEKDNAVYSELWNHLSQEAQDEFLYGAGVNLQAPLYTPQSAINELKTESLMQNAFSPTDKGFDLISWLRQTGKVS